MKSLNHNIRDLFFKNSCILCSNKANEKLHYLCYNCYDRLIKEGNLKNYNDIYYIWDYNLELKKLIEEYKFKNKLYIGELLYYLVGKQLDKVIEAEKINMILPIPITKKRLKERGFNQVEELLKFGGYNYLKLERVKETQHMYKILNKEERQKNIKSAFEIKKLDKKIYRVLIIDDIITTGSTVKEFIKELKIKNEKIEISVFTIALARTAKRIKLKMR